MVKSDNRQVPTHHANLLAPTNTQTATDASMQCIYVVCQPTILKRKEGGIVDLLYKYSKHNSLVIVSCDNTQFFQTQSVKQAI